MHRIPHIPDTTIATLPKLAWLELTEITLKIAYDLFALSKRLPKLHLFPWLAMRLLRFAHRALGHAPGHSHLEFRADLPVQI